MRSVRCRFVWEIYLALLAAVVLATGNLGPRGRTSFMGASMFWTPLHPLVFVSVAVALLWFVSLPLLAYFFFTVSGLLASVGRVVGRSRRG
jgi:hypothetical protein